MNTKLLKSFSPLTLSVRWKSYKHPGGIKYPGGITYYPRLFMKILTKYKY